MSRQQPLRLQYNNILNADYKPYLPIIGNQIPHKQIATFDGGDSLVFTELSGTATGGYDNIKSYHGKACYKVSLADNSSAGVALNFSTPIDLTSLGRKQNNYAQINQTGKYGNTQDQLFLVLNLLYQRANSNASSYSISVFNGTKEATLNSAYQPQQTNLEQNEFWKQQFGLNSTYFVYSGGFVDNDFTNITSIVIIITNPTGAGVSVYCLQDLILALPKTNSELFSATNPTIAGSYYPACVPGGIIGGNAIFVSQLFGNDAYTGTHKIFNTTSGPVRTIEQAIGLCLSYAYPYIVILDSATYKPVAVDGAYVGIQQSFTNNITIIADYLETPVISAKPGLFDLNRVGARTGLRTAFYENTAATGNILTVGAGGTYSTIGAANTAASAGDCIQILDSAVYNELLTCNKNITIEAAPGQTPTWAYTLGVTTLAVGTYAVNVYGITFKGNGLISGQRVTVGTSGTINLVDCTFTNIGTSTGHADAIYLLPTGTNTQTITNCLFSNNGENFTAINNVSGASGRANIINCLGYMGTSSANVFIQSGKANTNALNVFSVGSQSLSSYAAKITNAYFYYASDSAASTGLTNFYSLFCDTNECIEQSGGLSTLLSNITLLNDYFHDAYLTNTNLNMINVTNSNNSCTATILNNYFSNITGQIQLGNIFSFSNTATHAACNVKNNTFNNCQSICLSVPPSLGISFSNNVFYGCLYAVSITSSNVVMSNLIFSNCNLSIGISGTQHATLNNTIGWNSPLLGSNLIAYNGFVSDQNPGFIDPANGNFGWYYNSPIETLPEGLTSAIQNWALSSPVINPSGANLNFEYIDIEGFYNTALLSAGTSTVTATYCNINNSLIGKHDYNGLVNLYNCFVTGNGIAVRCNNANIISQSVNKNNIIDTNGTGIMTLSGSDIEHNTIINNNYGITTIFTGFYNQSEYMSRYLILKNNIVARNAAWDYVGTIASDYSIMPNRYYDSLPITNTAYVNTVGAHDQPGQPEIDVPAYFNQNLYNIYSFTYFPDTMYAGFMSNSPAWQTASDTWLNGQGQTVNKNIGARDIPALTTALDFAEYDLNYVGTVDSNDQFYALENPNTAEYSIKPINNESMRFITGEYENSPTAYTPELLLKWTTPGMDAKILDTGRAAFEGAFQGIWVVALSFDFGNTFIYYKVDKDGSMSMSQQSFVFNDTATASYGNYQLHLIQMPGTFIITDYLANMLGE